jgi:Type I restriction-modification system methyltransferase subunit
MSEQVKWANEDSVNDWVNEQLKSVGLKRDIDFFTESNMRDYLKESLRGSAKTIKKTKFGKPDFHTLKYSLPVIIENKFKQSKLIAETKDGVKFDDKAIGGYAVNGALYYARNMISSGKYKEVIAIGCAGDKPSNVEFKIYYVFGFGENSYKEMTEYKTFDFLSNEQNFEAFIKEATLTEEEKHDILIQSKEQLAKYAKALNKLMHNHNVTAPQRVLYVSGMLLSMQDVDKRNQGLVPKDLRGGTGKRSDGSLVVAQIEVFLDSRVTPIPEDKKRLMLASFNEIAKDSDRDKPALLDKEVAKFISDEKASANKQIFTFIYEYIFKSIDGMAGTLDIMGEMYSEFLKYALGDGKEIGIVLTPPYVTKMMAQILNVNKTSRVMDLATGSAGFLIASMELMIADAKKEGRRGSIQAENDIKAIKEHQLLGVELNAEMFTLAATNMILRGDGSSNIQKGNTFDTPASLYDDFQADTLLLNPPFSFEENGMPFIKFGLERMKEGGLAGIIIQDSAGSGKAVRSNKEMLKTNQLIASIKMPVDLFMPMAGVQTSIYILEHTNKPHDFDIPVKFIDFRNDGYKRTKRSLQELDNPTARYSDIVKIYKAGKSAKNLKADWNLEEVYVEEQITDSGVDWNFDQHKKIDTKPTFDDFRKTVSDYLSWEVDQILKSEDFSGK